MIKNLTFSIEHSFPLLREFLKKHLIEDIIPFWTTHALDAGGGINTCIGDDGTIINRDKWLWSQWRAVWVFAKLFNSVEPRREWLDIATGIYDFVRRHGWDRQGGGWMLCLDGEGKVLRGYESVYVDGFAIYALVELAKATGAKEPADLAVRTAEHALGILQQRHDRIPHYPYPVPAGARVHGLPMMFSLVFWELGQFLNDDRYRQAAVEMSDEIFAHFYRPHRDLIVERIGVDHRELPAPLGTAVVPGHVIEDMWFQIHIARDRGDTQRVAQAIHLIRRHLELGWDKEFGGISLAVDAGGAATVGWDFADTKIWWPHTEAMYALLLADRLCHEPWCMEWYNRVHEYSFGHFANTGQGEWRQRLNRDGSPMTGFIALPVKDPFHLPRSLILCLETLSDTSP